MSSSDVLLAHIKLSTLADYVIPSKTTAYLATGKPILMAAGGAAAVLINEIGAGISIEPGDPSTMAEAIKQLSMMKKEELSKMGKLGRDYFLSNLSKEVVIPLYESVLEDATRKSGKRG